MPESSPIFDYLPYFTMKSKLQYLPALWQRIDFFDTATMFQFCLHKTNTVHVISQCCNPLTHSVDDSLLDFNGTISGNSSQSLHYMLRLHAIFAPTCYRHMKP